MNMQMSALSLGVVVCAAAVAACSGSPADGPLGQTQAADQLDEIAEGKQLFDNALPGTNGRSCATCHVESENTALSIAHVAALAASDPGNVLFNPIDSDDPTAATPTYAHVGAGLVRVSISIADNLDVIDADGNVITNATRTVDVWRGVPTVANTAYTAPYQYDGRFATLEIQANAALEAHSQIDHPPSADTLGDIASYEQTKFTGPAAEVVAALVDLGLDPTPDLLPDFPPDTDLGAGEALYKSTCAQCHGTGTANIMTSEAVRDESFAVINPDGSVTPAYTLPIGVSIAAQYNTAYAQNAKFFNIGVAAITSFGQLGLLPNFTGVSFPQYHIRFYTDATRTTKVMDLPPPPPAVSPSLAPQPFSVDPGRALITGNPNDWEAFKIPQLRGIAGTAPYFHDCSAPDLPTVVDIYSRLILPVFPALNRPEAYPPEGPGLPPESLSPTEKTQLLAYLQEILRSRGRTSRPRYSISLRAPPWARLRAILRTWCAGCFREPMNVRRFFTLQALVRLVRRLVIAVGIYALLGFVILPRVGRSVAEKKLTELLHRRTTIGKVSFNPFTLAVTIDRLAILDRDGGPFVAFEQLYLDFQALSVVKGGVILRDIILKAPALTVVRETPTTYSFTDLIEQFTAPPDPPPDPAKPSKPARYSLNNIRILGGSIDLVDKPKQATHTVRDINVAVPFLSNLPYDLESYVQPSFEASVNGTPLALKGRTKPFSESRETSFDIDFTDLSIPKYMEYVPVALRFTVPTGLIDAQVALSFDQHADRPPDLTVTGHLAMRDLAAVDLQNKPVLSLALLDVTLGPSDVFGGKAVIEKVRLEKPVIHVQRDAQGKVNLASLGPAAEPAPAAPAPPAAPAADEPKASPFVVQIAETHLVGGQVHFADVAPSPQTTFATAIDVDVDVLHFSTEPGKPAALDVRLRTDAGETIHHAGDLVLQPLTYRGKLELKGLLPKRYAPYYAPSVLLDLDDGTFDVTSKIDLDLAGKSPKVVLSELGIVLTNLHVHKRGEKRELFGFDALEVKDASLDLEKHALVLGEVTSHKGHVVVDRAGNGAINLASLVPPPRREAEGGARARRAAHAGRAVDGAGRQGRPRRVERPLRGQGPRAPGSAVRRRAGGHRRQLRARQGHALQRRRPRAGEPRRDGRGGGERGARSARGQPQDRRQGARYPPGAAVLHRQDQPAAHQRGPAGRGRF